MSIVVRFPASDLTKDQYDSVRAVIEQTGVWPADGCQVHAAFGPETDIQVIEIWESREKFETFGERLGPIMAAASIELSGQPEVLEALVLEAF